MAEGIQTLDFEKPIVEIENRILELQETLKNIPEADIQKQSDITKGIKSLQKKCEKLKQDTYASLSPAQKVQLARHPKRPYSLDYINLLFKDFTELHGDRNYSDDKALITGFGIFENNPAAIIGQQKGRTLQENMSRNFGMMHPEGYRKALRILKLAEKFSKPVVVFIDTPGAYPGVGAEERGQSEAIARNLKEMSMIETPIICIIIGEGGSGGALGIGVGDKILMLENSYYSVITPEGCAAILFKDSGRYAEAAEFLKITANDLYKLKVIDEVIPEPLGGAHRDINITAENIKSALKKHLSELKQLQVKKLVQSRYKKFRKMGFVKTKRQNLK